MNLNRFFDKYSYIIVLIVLSLVTHHYIFTDPNTLSSGDWVFYFNESVSSLLNYSLYLKPYGFGNVMVLPSNWVFYWVSYMMMQLSLTWDIFTRIVFLFPIAFITPITSYFLNFKILKNRLAASIATMIYIFNPFFLKLNLDWVTYANIWWISPLLFLLVLKFYETKKKYLLPMISIFVSIGIVYEIRIMIIVLGFLFLYSVINLITNKIKTIKEFSWILISLTGGLILHAFWIVPMVFGSLFSGVISAASSNPFISFFDIVDIFTLRSYQWNNGMIYEAFIIQDVDIQLFLVPLLFITGIFFLKTNKGIAIPIKISLLIITITLMFLGKQGHLPYTTTYKWLFNNIPLFNIYRESSKFFIIIALGISIISGIGAMELSKYIGKKSKLVASIFILLVVGIILSNTKHFITQKIGMMTKGVEIPNEDILLKDKLVQDPGFYRVMWYPFKPRFAYYSDNRPYVLREDINIIKEKFDWYKDLTVTNNLFNQASIRYIILPSEQPVTINYGPNRSAILIEGYRHYGDRQEFEAKINKLIFLNKVDLVKGYIVYENKGYLPNVYATEEIPTLAKPLELIAISAKDESPYLNKVELKNIGEKTYITLSDQYSPLWGVKYGSFDWKTILNTKNNDIPTDYHIKNEAGLNTFVIDPDYIKKNLSQNDYQLNSDGSINILMNIYFKPMSYVFIGGIISLTTLAGILSYLFGYTGRAIYLKLRTKSQKHV